MAPPFRNAARRAGLRILGSASWNPQGHSYRRIAQQVAASGARAVVLLGNLNTNSAAVIRDLRAVLGNSVTIIGWQGNTPVSELFAQAGRAARGVYMSGGGPALDPRHPAAQKFVRDFGAT